MITIPQLSALIAQLPDARAERRPDGDLDWLAGRHVFLRVAADEQTARLWTADMGMAPVLRAQPRVFPEVQAFTFRIAYEVALARIDPVHFAELLLDSFAIRSGTRRAERVDQTVYFGVAGR